MGSKQHGRPTLFNEGNQDPFDGLRADIKAPLLWNVFFDFDEPRDPLGWISRSKFNFFPLCNLI